MVEPSRISPRLPLLIRPLIFALGAVVLLFVVYDVVERTWLSDLDYRRLEMLHQLRGLFAALVAATLVGWLILRRSAPLLETALSNEDWTLGARLSEEERNKVYARWFVRMRWTAIVVAGILIVLTVLLAELLPRQVLLPLILAVGVLAALNAVYLLLIRRGRAGAALLSFQAYADLVILTVLLHFSGGIENPLAPLMLFHVIIAGIILSRRECFIVATIAAVLFALLGWIEMMDVLPHYTLGIFPHFEHEGNLTHAAHNLLYVASSVVLQSAILLLSAFFVTTLADRLRQDERQLKQFAERMRTERQLLERALETTGTGLCVCDPDLHPLWHNLQWDAWFAQDARLDGVASPARRTLEDGGVRVTEIEVVRAGACTKSPSQETLTFQATTAPLMDDAGAVSQVVQLVQDVTEQKRAQSNMMRAGQLAAVGELAGQVAHEVNNPTAIISAKSRLLLANHRNEMSEKVAQEISKITEMADRVAGIAQGLLSYCRPSAGTRTRLDLRVPIRKALILVEERARLAGVEIEDRLGDRACNVCANAGEMEQVFLNLYLNSLKAMPTGGRLAVSIDRGDPVAISVEDTGIGIESDVQNRVFEPFFTTRTNGDGSGLGLSICLGLVRSHGGAIELTSEPGEGTRVTVKLPPDTTETAGNQYG